MSLHRRLSRVQRAATTPYRPLLTDAARPATFDVRAVDEHGEVARRPIAGEHPLTLYVDKHELVTLMTLGGAPEALAIGYLRNQRLVDSHRGHRRGAGRLGGATRSSVTTRNGLADLEAKTREAHRRPPAAARARCSAT